MSDLALAISTCPNDTFACAGLLEDAVDRRGLELTIELCDIDELNQRLASGRDDVLKTSFYAALQHADQIAVLPVGSALGYGVGPVLLGASSLPAGQAPRRVLAPGPDTTAALLFEALHPDAPSPEHVLFSDIVPALEAGTADWGVCIHEGRFTWREHGLTLIQDLGQRFEQETHSPLPLGGLVARRSVPLEDLQRLVAALSDSLAWAAAHPERSLEVMREHAQEHSDEVLWQHVELYVNETTRELGFVGRRALLHFAQWAERAGRVPVGTRLAVFDPRRAELSTSPGRAPRLFHLVDAARWRAWDPSAGPWSPASLAGEGFVHLSLAEQLAGTLEAHFSASPPLVLVELDPEQLGAQLRFEPSRAGALFPHLYRALTAADLAGQWPLERIAGAWCLPQLASEPEADQPPASPAPA